LPAASGSAAPEPTIPPTPTPRPELGGTELYGYLPYWQMSDRMAKYLARVPVSTLALFSVGPDGNGAIKKSDIGYRRITGARGRGLIADAHARGQRVDLVFTSFGKALNTQLFSLDLAGQARRARAVADLVALARSLRVDGVNVDVEQVQGDISLGYVGFIGALRAGLKALGRHATLSVATTSNHDGAELARLAIIGGADRVFLMGYEYHWSGSGPGASSPIQNRDPGLDLTQSIVDYVNTGVPRTQLLLGLPLYGMTWQVAGADLPSVAVGKGQAWIPANHVDLLTSSTFSPTLDPIEVAESFIVPDGDGWAATYYDSPRTLQPKLELARSQGLAGSGFWALGYEYGLPGYLDLMTAFRAGRIGG
ncbi:MAG TPA: glycosyl hydrolase family 18 protein, partial [Candidatus Limnocylindrales bacterium]|nr:glycosyl hydrolase family 18 protein [Candidatus Limnocylindrales bacterium]